METEKSIAEIRATLQKRSKSLKEVLTVKEMKVILGEVAENLRAGKKIGSVRWYQRLAPVVKRVSFVKDDLALEAIAAMKAALAVGDMKTMERIVDLFGCSFNLPDEGNEYAKKLLAKKMPRRQTVDWVLDQLSRLTTILPEQEYDGEVEEMARRLYGQFMEKGWRQQAEGLQILFAEVIPLED